MKKTLSVLLSIVLITTILLIPCGAVNADNERASLYFNAIGVWLHANGDDSLTLTVEVDCKHDMDEIGVTKLLIQKQTDGEWHTVRTVWGTTTNGFITTNDYIHFVEYDYDAIGNQLYRAIVTAYAEDADGSDSRTYTSETVRA